MKRFFVVQLGIMITGTATLFVFGAAQQAASFMMGAALVLANIALLTWAWDRILQKKQIALATSIIVFKYGILAVILYKILQHPTTNIVWFSVGLSSLLVTAFIGGVICRST